MIGGERDDMDPIKQRVDWNRTFWEEGSHWTNDGEEWSFYWGSSVNQWHRTIFPRIMSFIPAGRILEIATGQGRWTRFLLQHCHKFIGVDIAANCVQVCQRRFSFERHATFVQNDGKSLSVADNGSVDFIFSFDSLVHAEIDAMEPYVQEIARILSNNGTGFIHHSNLADIMVTQNPQARARSVSATIFRELCAKYGLWVFAQEVVNWGDDGLIDCFSAFRQAGGRENLSTAVRTNPDFLREIKNSGTIYELFSGRSNS